MAPTAMLVDVVPVVTGRWVGDPVRGSGPKTTERRRTMLGERRPFGFPLLARLLPAVWFAAGRPVSVLLP
ncbi:hypothetical protein, partial [Streptomyces sp. NPDC060198]|uniref:hypothetical protein n=1 Tax=Streptomyces sp. NPDC060198 TaxID=3347070 RepID=UPI00365ADB53